MVRPDTRHVPHLTEPHADVHQSLLEAVREHHTAGGKCYIEVRDIGEDEHRFCLYVEILRRRIETGLADGTGRVPETVLWWVDG